MTRRHLPHAWVATSLRNTHSPFGPGKRLLSPSSVPKTLNSDEKGNSYTIKLLLGHATRSYPSHKGGEVEETLFEFSNPFRV